MEAGKRWRMGGWGDAQLGGVPCCGPRAPRLRLRPRAQPHSLPVSAYCVRGAGALQEGPPLPDDRTRRNSGWRGSDGPAAVAAVFVPGTACAPGPAGGRAHLGPDPARACLTQGRCARAKALPAVFFFVFFFGATKYTEHNIYRSDRPQALSSVALSAVQRPAPSASSITGSGAPARLSGQEAVQRAGSASPARESPEAAVSLCGPFADLPLPACWVRDPPTYAQNPVSQELGPGRGSPEGGVANTSLTPAFPALPPPADLG